MTDIIARHESLPPELINKHLFLHHLKAAAELATSAEADAVTTAALQLMAREIERELPVAAWVSRPGLTTYLITPRNKTPPKMPRAPKLTKKAAPTGDLSGGAAAAYLGIASTPFYARVKNGVIKPDRPDNRYSVAYLDKIKPTLDYKKRAPRK